MLSEDNAKQYTNTTNIIETFIPNLLIQVHYLCITIKLAIIRIIKNISTWDNNNTILISVYIQ